MKTKAYKKWMHEFFYDTADALEFNAKRVRKLGEQIQLGHELTEMKAEAQDVIEGLTALICTIVSLIRIIAEEFID